MKTRKKIVSIILSLAMVISLMPMALAAGSGYQDTDGHWAETAIDRWSGYGILEGDSGNFNPDGALTRAQMAAILSRLLNLPDAPDAGFSDVKPDDWFAEYINKCAAAGIMLGDNGKANPNEPITRQQAIVMIARALGIQPIENPDLTKYADAAQVSAYAQGYVAALIEAGIVGGVTADLLAPQANINRASTVTILDRTIGTYANEAGQTVKADGNGLTLIVAKDVKLIDVPEGARIVVADGATGLTVNGKAVSDDQTYIVPETTTDTPSGGSSSGGSSSGGGHSHRYTYTDNGDGTHTGKCYADDSTRGPEKHIYISGTCIVCGAEAEGKTASVKNTEGVIHYYDTLTEAIDAAGAGDTVYLLADVNLSSTLSVSKDVTLDLNGHNIHGELVRAVHVTAGTLTLTGSGIVSSNVADVANSVIRVGGDAEANAGLVVGKDVTISTATAYGVAAFGTTTETVEINGTVTSTAPANNAYDGCAVSTVGSDSTAASITINDGAVISATNTNAIYMPSGNLTVNGGTITGRTGIYVKSGSTTVKGGTITGNGAAVEYNYYGNGGISTGDALVVDSCGYPNGNPQVSVTGGTFTSTNAEAVASYATKGNSAVTNFITGGTFSSDPSEYLANGFTAVENNGVWTLTDPVAKIGDTYYGALYEAVNACKSTETIELLCDVTLNEAKVTYGGWANCATDTLYGTLDGNNHTITLGKNIFFGTYFGSRYFSKPCLKNVDIVANNGSVYVQAYEGLFENVKVSGSIEVGNNTGAFVIYGTPYYGELTFNNCEMAATMYGGGTANNYNAAFVGYGMGTGETFNFENCKMTGSLTCGVAALFLGNDSQLSGNWEVNVSNFTFGEDAVVRNTLTSGYSWKFNGIVAANNAPGTPVVTIDGTEYSGADGFTKLVDAKNTIWNAKHFAYGPTDKSLTLTKNEDGTFTITPAATEGVAKYVVTLAVYSTLKEGGSGLQSVKEEISAPFAESKTITTTLKDLKFIDVTWVGNNPTAQKDTLADNTIYMLDGVSYYMITDNDLCTLNGNPKSAQIYGVTAYDANGNIVASAPLTR